MVHRPLGHLSKLNANAQPSTVRPPTRPCPCTPTFHAPAIPLPTYTPRPRRPPPILTTLTNSSPICYHSRHPPTCQPLASTHFHTPTHPLTLPPFHPPTCHPPPMPPTHLSPATHPSTHYFLACAEIECQRGRAQRGNPAWRATRPDCQLPPQS